MLSLLHGVNLKHVQKDDVVHITGASLQLLHRWHALGTEAYRKRQVAHVVLAGGSATRFGGGAKALVEVELGIRLIDKFTCWPDTAPMDLMFMTSRGTHQQVADALKGRPYRVFQQFESPRMLSNGEFARDEHGHVQLAPTGHGDLPDALRVSGLLGAFLARGGRYVVIHNIDNYRSVPDPVLLGQHIDSRRNVSVELVERLPTDVGGMPVWVNDRIELVEQFRLPPEFDPAGAMFHNTNTLAFNAEALDRTYPWTYFPVQKQVNGQTVIQRERLIQEMTQWLDTNYRVVHRSRFQAIKTQADLTNLQGVSDR
jgi:UTP--glucose-1-phosphate uridylyltransferase